ncbi:MAG: ABC transporter substrate-binding protein [Sulfuricaulis sp.]|uniref:ABC transporter substrate-binding protein n=1 Tax=Sulfuricaulis sp. TaxID=2003553 RepID=UPI0025F2C77A|nr:ABC transporter substrate-binding protein [Sulfuricaulis sp.]MCR4346486.1 ABC transporter substrate-binding protein [Sulfuricaulis sp.]
MKRPGATRYALLAISLIFSASAAASWNNPYPAAESKSNILYSAFRERPKTFDPARAYSSNEYLFIAQIYEPPFQYHYLKRPYTLTPLTAVSVPIPVYFDKHGSQLPRNTPATAVAYSVYEIHIRPGIYYQPHPAFARDAEGRYLYHALSTHDLAGVYAIGDFPHTGTRELVAADYVYQIKRLAHPKVHSPILSVMNEYIVGIREYAGTLKKEYEKIAGGRDSGVYLDLVKFPLAGVEEVDRYTYRVKLHGKYPQLLYWMAMPFFAPMPPEADRFFSQPGMAEKNLTLDWFPVGSGAYMLTVNNPNRQMVLERNPNYHEELYPAEGEPGDDAAGLLDDAGKRMPFIDKVVFSLDKESIPRWNKFLQGYYDRSAVLTEGFDQAIRFTGEGDTEVSDAMKQKGIRLLTSVAASTYYLGFNILDPVVGGYTERARKLRQAISIAVDFEEQISIFENGRGIAAQGPLAPGIFGYREGQAGINPYVYDWVEGKPRRKPIEYARQLLAEAGYPRGMDPASGKPLSINYETPAIGPERKAQLDWMLKQFSKLGIQLVVRATDYNRFQEKMRKGDAQIYDWGWNADYPDPENFLFLLYGPNKKVGHDGENASNYDNPEFNRLFERMKNMENTTERAAIINQMLEIVRRDTPWIWGMHPKNFQLEHTWMYNAKLNQMANNTLKYSRLDPDKRAEQRAAWNRPVVWPIVLALGTLVVGAVPAVVTYRKREREGAA